MAPSKKRKRTVGGDSHDDDDDDGTHGLRQILPVANLPIHFDGEPVDGMQYLFTVRYVLSTTFASSSRMRWHPQARRTETTRHQERRQSLRSQPSAACSIR